MVASPTGTGYVNYAAVSILEFLTRGDCATVAMQYSARPSPLSLDRVERRPPARARCSCAALRDRLAQCPPGRRPKVVLFGESLGAWTSQDAFVDRGTQGLVDAGIDHAIWIGTPHFSKWKEQVLYDDRPDVDREPRRRVQPHRASWRGARPGTRDRHALRDDHALRRRRRRCSGRSSLIQAPEWLGRPETRHATGAEGHALDADHRFFQVLVDMKNAANVVPGVFAAKGHDYRADLLPFFHAMLGFDATPDQLASIAAWLEAESCSGASG